MRVPVSLSYYRVAHIYTESMRMAHDEYGITTTRLDAVKSVEASPGIASTSGTL